MFKKAGVLTHKNFSEAEAQGYMFELTDSRLVFRTPYGQPDSFRTEVTCFGGVKAFMWEATSSVCDKVVCQLVPR